MIPILFFAPGLPKTKGSKNAFIIPGKDGKKHRAIVVDVKSDDLKRWASTVAWEARKVAPTMLIEEPIYIQLNFFLNPPKALSKKHPSYAVKKPDLDKLVRAVLDCLQNVLYVSDSQCIKIVATKSYNPKVGVLVLVEHANVLLSYLPGQAKLLFPNDSK